MKNEYVNIYTANGRSLGATNEWQRVPDAFDYIIFRDGNVVKTKNGRTGKIEFKNTRADNLVQQLVSKLEEERFSSHRGATIAFDYGLYTFKKPVVVKKIPLHFVGQGLGGSGHQIGSTIIIDWENWEGDTWSYDVDGDGAEETIYPAFVFQYDDDGTLYANTSRVDGLMFTTDAASLTGSEQPVGVFADIVGNLRILNNKAFGASLAFFRGSLEGGLTEEEINLGLVGKGSYYNKIAFNDLDGVSKKLIGISFFNGANEAIVLGNSNVANYDIGLYIQGDGIRVMGNSFEGNTTGIKINYAFSFIINNRYEGNTTDIEVNGFNNIIFDLAKKISTTRTDFIHITPELHTIDLSYYWYDSALGTDGYWMDIIFDRFAKLEAITRSSGKLQLVRTDTSKYLRKEGSVTLSGDGTSTTIQFEHGMQSTPQTVIVIPNSLDAAGFKHAYADDTYVYIVYDTAPPSGTDNLKYSYILIV